MYEGASEKEEGGEDEEMEATGVVVLGGEGTAQEDVTGDEEERPEEETWLPMLSCANSAVACVT